MFGQDTNECGLESRMLLSTDQIRAVSPIAIRNPAGIGETTSSRSRHPGILNPLPDTLGGRKASGDLKRVDVDDMRKSTILGERHRLQGGHYREVFCCVRRLPRSLGSRVEVFGKPATGLRRSVFFKSERNGERTSKAWTSGSAATVGGRDHLRKGNFFVRVLGTSDKALREHSSLKKSWRGRSRMRLSPPAPLKCRLCLIVSRKPA